MTSSYAGVERRQRPRAGVEGRECRLDLRTWVRLLDISLNGALIASDVQLPDGTRAQLRTGVDTGPVTPTIEVRRAIERRVGGVPVLAMGAVFVEMDEHSRRSLEAFLKKASR